MMGIPEEHRATVLAQSTIILSGGDPDLIEDQDDPLNAFLLAGMELAGLMERLAHPRQDLTTALVTTEVDGEQLSHQEIASFSILLLVAVPRGRTSAWARTWPGGSSRSPSARCSTSCPTWR